MISSRCHCGTKANACHNEASLGDHCSKFCTSTVQCAGKFCQALSLKGLVCNCHWLSCWLINRAVALSSCASAMMSSGSNIPTNCGKPFLISSGFFCQYSAKNCSAVISDGRHRGIVWACVGIGWFGLAAKYWRDCSIAGVWCRQLSAVNSSSIFEQGLYKHWLFGYVRANTPKQNSGKKATRKMAGVWAAWVGQLLLSSASIIASLYLPRDCTAKAAPTSLKSHHKSLAKTARLFVKNLT